MTIHELKTWPEFYEQVICGAKTFEIRRDDRGFRVGDVLCLREWNPATKTYTGRTYYTSVSYTLTGTAVGIADGFVVMALGSIPWPSMDAVLNHQKRTPTEVASAT